MAPAMYRSIEASTASRSTSAKATIFPLLATSIFPAVAWIAPGAGRVVVVGLAEGELPLEQAVMKVMAPAAQRYRRADGEEGLNMSDSGCHVRVQRW